jgi:hypothetical protein
VNTTRSLHFFIYIKMEDSSDQQWSWAMAVGAVFALYGVCSLYSWIANADPDPGEPNPCGSGSEHRFVV